MNQKEQKIEDDIFGQIEQLNRQYEQKFLKEIHPLIKKYHNITGNDFEYEDPGKVTIKYESHYWVVDGDIMKNLNAQTGLWFDEKGRDIHGRTYGGERNGDFYLIARLCCKYEKEIKSKIQFDLKEMMR